MTEAIDTDALIVGAGPVGLFQAFQLGLLEVRCHLVDALPDVGGQCVELYGDKPIYDIPALPVASGRELTERLVQQIAPFDIPRHLAQQVSGVGRRADGRWDVETSAGTRFVATVVVVAGGIGAFMPRGLKVDGIERFAAWHDDGDAVAAGTRAVVVGGEQAAADAALRMARAGADVTLVHRRDVFDAALHATPGLRVLTGQVSGYAADGDALRSVDVTPAAGDDIRTLPCDRLLVLLGLSPKLGPIAQWGLAMERKQLVVDTERFETSAPGIHAVGDIVTYPGKRKLIVCGFHEATLAAWAAAARVHPQRPLQLQYTTTSPRLHALLKVSQV